MKKRLLILEDDVVLLETLHAELQLEYDVDMAKHGEAVLDLTAEKKYDLYIFDINVPYISGLTLLQELRSSSDTTAAIFLTSKNKDLDKIKGFESGCDDYLTKPFSMTELKLRISALLRRTTASDMISHEDIDIDLKNNYVSICGIQAILDRKALEMLHLFISYPKTVFSQMDIVDRIYEGSAPSSTVIRVHISKINTLFGTQKRIKNIRGVGYRYDSA